MTVTDTAAETMHGYSVHPAADIFPLIEGVEFDSFCEDIRTHGLMEPVVIDAASGQLIDGRNRVRACNRLGLTVKTTQYDGLDVTQFVISHNLHRRHLTDSQRAMIAGKLATRKIGYSNRIAHLSSGEKDHMGHVIPPSIDEAAALLGVKANTVKRAKVILRDGTPDLVGLAASGKTPITSAARVSELPPEEQDEYAARVNAGADPVAAAPPDLNQQRHDVTRAAKNPPKAPRRKGGQHLSMLDSITETLRVWRLHSLKDITELDSSVTTEEATRLRDDLSESISALRRINGLLKERIA
jgi:ParB-like chromosome segregation protein Spo0J